MSQLTCVAFLSFSVATELPFVTTEFICQSSAFYVATEEYFHDRKTLYCDRTFISALSSAIDLLRHLVVGCDIVLLACLKLCHDIQKLCRDKD